METSVRLRFHNLNLDSITNNPEANRLNKYTKDSPLQPETVPPIPMPNVLFLDEERASSPNSTRKTQKNLLSNPNPANIFRVKGGSSSQRKDRLTYVRYENYTSARNRKTAEQKIYEINSFVKKLTDNMNQEEEVPQISETKFRALKKIIQYYDIKNLEKSQYSNVIKSFGLQIGSMRAEQKTPSFSQQKRQEIKRLRAMSLLNRTDKKLQPKRLDKTFIELENSQLGQSHAKDLMTVRNPKSKEARSQPLNLFSSLQVRKDKLRAGIQRKFKFTSGENIILEKLNKYREFLFILNYSNRLYRPLNIDAYSAPLKFYVGRGNNGNLIRSLMRKRFWFEQVNTDQQAHFVWTQIKLPHLFEKQQSIEYFEVQTVAKGTKKQALKLNTAKNDPMARIMSGEQLKETSILLQVVKNKNITSFQDRLRVCRRTLKKEVITFNQIVHNHLPGNGMLGNKKGMFLCLREYCRLTNNNIFQIVPKTFIISKGVADPQFPNVVSYYNQRKTLKKANFWILKPGEFSNRGNGIECTNKLDDIKKRVTKCSRQNKNGSIIVQEYITKPLLYNGRKFDLRTYMLITSHNKKTKAYWYQDGYVRTSSAFFTLEQTDPYIHLTNDAVQVHSDRYGRFQDGNKLSYPELQRYLDGLPANGRNLDLYNILIPQMREIAALAVRATWLSLNRENTDKNFELFGLDFMVDQDFKPWLIEINTNPCLELSSPVLQRLIPHMVENVLRMSLDTLFPPPDNFGNNYKYNIPQNSLHYNKFEVIFDSDRDGPQIRSLYAQAQEQFFGGLQGLEEDKNEYKQQGELISVDDI